MNERYAAVARQMREWGKGYYGKPVSAARIEKAKAELGVLLPKSYCWFLREFGYSSWPDEIYGLDNEGKLFKAYDLLENVKGERELFLPHPPHHLIPFSPDGFGNHYCLDTSQLQNGECPVVFWDHEMGEEQIPEQTNNTFLEWLEEHIKWEMEAQLEEASEDSSES